MLVKEFDYDLPKELIAQKPADKRDASRLLLLSRTDGQIQEGFFKDIVKFLIKDDLLVLNETKVIPARIFGNLEKNPNKLVELLLLREIEDNIWEALARPAKKLQVGVVLKFKDATATILERKESGIRVVRFEGKNVISLLEEKGEIALPPYIKSAGADIKRYQTVYAKNPGSVAAPTAGLHFTTELLNEIESKGVEIKKITLHAGLGTFRPVQVETVEHHKMYFEEFELNQDVADSINRAKREKRRVIAVGTTVVRTLESQALDNTDGIWQVRPHQGMTDLYIYPGYKYKIIDALITNFHLPKSTLLMLICAFAPKQFIFNAYQYAIKNQFKFYSFGDAMFIY